MSPSRKTFCIPFFAIQCSVLTAIISLILAGQCFGQSRVEIPSQLDVKVDKEDLGEFIRIDELIQAKQYKNAVESMIGLIDRFASRQTTGSKLFRIGGSSEFIEHYRSPLDTCHLKILGWSKSTPEALSEYRKQVDPLAKVVFDSAKGSAKKSQLEKLKREYFLSSYGDQALFQLGSIYFDDGEIERARQTWSLLIPSPSSEESVYRGRRLEYPDSNIPLADIRGRIILTWIVQRKFEIATREMDQFAKDFPDSTTMLLGQEKPWLEHLKQLKKQISDRIAKSSAPISSEANSRKLLNKSENDGDFLRNEIAVGQSDPSGRPIWISPLPTPKNNRDILDDEVARVGENAVELLTQFPTILDQSLVWHDGIKIYGSRLDNGKPIWSDSNVLWEPPYNDVFPKRDWNQIGVQRFTLSTNQSRVFARLGGGITGSQDNESRARSFLVGLDFQREGRLLPGFPIRPQSERLEFEGSPIVDDDQLFVLCRQTTPESSSVSLHLECYELPPFSSAQNLRPKWSLKICDATSIANGAVEEITHNVLSKSGNLIICNSNLGAIAAIDIEQATVKWLNTYPRKSIRENDPFDAALHLFRDWNPAMIVGNKVIVAPTDSESIFCFSKTNGQFLWETTAPDSRYLICSSEKNVVSSGIGLSWFDLESGARIANFPNVVPSSVKGLARQSLIGFGRPVATTTEIYWPTQNAIFVLDRDLKKGANMIGKQKFSVRLNRKIDLRIRQSQGGNLLIRGDRLVIASSDSLRVFNNTGQIADDNQ